VKRTPTPALAAVLALILLALVPLQANAQSAQPKTLYDAASHGDLAQLQIHIDKGADLNKPDRRGQTALGRAVQSNRAEAVALLVTAGADLDTPSGGVPPLLLAVLNRQPDNIALFVEKGANVNLADTDGRTPLLVATENAQMELVQALVAKGANVNAKDARGQTPLSLAKRGRQTEIAAFLTEHGATEPVNTYGRDPYGREGMSPTSDMPYTQGQSTYGTSAEPSVLADPNAIRAKIALYPDLGPALQAVDANAASIGRSWASRRSDNRTTLIRAVAKQFTSEMNFVTAIATKEKATATLAGITELSTQRQARYEHIASQLRDARRLAQQEAKATMTRGRGRTSSRGGRGATGRAQGPGAYGDPAQMADPYGAPPMRGPPRARTTAGVPEQALAPETQAQLDAWLRADPADKRDLLGAVHELDVAEYDALRQVAVEEKAEKTTAALEALMLARQGRRDGVLVKMAADDLRAQRMAERYGTPGAQGRGQRGQGPAQPGDPTMPRRGRRSR